MAKHAARPEEATLPRAKDWMLWAHAVWPVLMIGACARPPLTAKPVSPMGPVLPTLTASRVAPHAHGKRGDLVLEHVESTWTFATSVDSPGQRPLRGALVDASVEKGDLPDILLWFRSGIIGADGVFKPLVAESVAPFRCSDARVGVKVQGTIGTTLLESIACPDLPGQLLVRTRATSLGAGAKLADEINPGTSHVLVRGQGKDWEGEKDSEYVILGERGNTFLYRSLPFRARRRLVHISGEFFPAPLVLEHQGSEIERTVRIARGDVFDALGRVTGARERVTLRGAAGGSFWLYDSKGAFLAEGNLPESGLRTLLFPRDFGAELKVWDRHGIPVGTRIELTSLKAVLAELPAPPHGKLEIEAKDDQGKEVAVHMLLRGKDGTEDPSPQNPDGGFAEGRSVYFTHGKGSTVLAKGKYEVVLTHGPTHTLWKQAVEIKQDETLRVNASLTEVVHTNDWISADLHLHAQPSPDSTVSLEARVATLVCEGVDLGIATDHNHITDYGPVVRQQRVDDRFSSIVGDEITSAGSALYGHFNAFPLKVEAEVPPPPYYATLPKDMFAFARARGAKVIQVNHGRMEPRLGYFDLVHLHPESGVADPEFSDNFDAVETHNGLYMEQPERVREAVFDVVSLARRGLRPAVTGNSDSHRLLYEEAGYPRTYVHAARFPVVGREDRLLAGLAARNTTVSGGPFVEAWVVAPDGSKPIGSTVTTSAGGKLAVHVRVTAPGWVPVERAEVWIDDKIVQSFTFPNDGKDGVRFEKDVELGLNRDAVVWAWASAETPLPDVLPQSNAKPVGFTGLFYVDADRDGKVVIGPR